ncbi:MAG TPA: molybdopterin-dependent oxidoreductase, partial [Candidatus Rubneribacter avistercoris]|nr:molybdopterin-dependent oxidoreductase [Candidatus Rubneribacter avistercoris]
MGKLNITRRGFLQLAAATATVAGLQTGGRAFAETAPAGQVGSETKVVRTCCRACGKNECGVLVTVVDGRAIKVEGDADTAFHSMGNCCTKSQSSMQAAYHPDRLYHPMKRTKPKGEADPGWVRITWDEAYETIADKFYELKDRYGGESMFFIGGTSRIWTQHTYDSYGKIVDSPNALTAWQICKGPRHFATTLVSSYAYSWMATTDRPRVFVSWGCASEISNYDESCRTTVDLVNKADHYISVDPRMTNLGHESDIHQWLTPGTDGALALAWANVIINEGLYDDLYVKRWMNAPFLVVEGMEPSGGTYNLRSQFAKDGGLPMRTRLLKEMDIKEGGSERRFMVWDELAGVDEAHPLHDNDPTGHLTYFDAETGLWEGEPDEPWERFYESPQQNLPEGYSQGRVAEASPFNPEIDPALYGEFQVTLKDGSVHSMRPVWDVFVESLEEYTPEKAAVITGVAADQIELAARTYATRIDPSTGYGNGGIQYALALEHACNSIQNSRAFDAIVGMTGNFDTPAGHRGGTKGKAGSAQPICHSMSNPPANYDGWFEKLLGAQDLPMLSWWQMWADAAHVYHAALTGEPYPVRGGLCEASDHMNQANASVNYEALQSLDFFVVQDLWKTPTAGMADILLPVQHWLEVDYPRTSQGSTGAQGACCRCIEPPADVKIDTEICVDVHRAMNHPWVSADNSAASFFGEGNYWPTMEELLDQTVAQMGMTWQEYKEAFQEHGWWDCKELLPETWGTYRRYETGRITEKKGPGGNYIKGFATPTGKQELWSVPLETYMPGSGFELPTWDPALETELGEPGYSEEWPFLMTTGRRIPVYFHSEHRQLPWCRELWPAPRVEINPADAAQLGIEQGDWVWIESPRGKIRQTADLYYGIAPGVINCEHQWWFPELPQADHGFALCNVNCLVEPTHQDPICGSSHLRAYGVKVYKATPENSPFGNPCPCGVDGTPIICDASD